MFAFQLRFRARMQALIPMSMSVSNGFLDPALQEMMRSTDLRRCYNPRTSLSCLVDDLSPSSFSYYHYYYYYYYYYFILFYFIIFSPHFASLHIVTGNFCSMTVVMADYQW